MPECVSFTLTKSNPYFLKRRKYTLNLTVTDIKHKRNKQATVILKMQKL